MVNTKDISRELEERILLLDGGFGTMLQRYAFSEEDYRGEEFKDWKQPLKGCNDLLSFTQQDTVREIHAQYLKAGSDIIETNSFNANSISLADYGLEAYAYQFAKASAEVARAAADEFTARNPKKPRFVAGSIGPTNRTSSIASDVNNPANREVTFTQLVEAYTEQVRGLYDGGAHVMFVETIFDTLNAKAALYAIEKLSEELHISIPIMVSGTLADTSGRTLSGQTIDAFYASISHARLISVGFNCAFGAKQLLPYLEQLSNIADFYISTHPNAGLPNIMGGYDETPQMFAADIEEYMKRGVINIVGGCCGTTPEHIYELSKIVNNYPPRKITAPKHITQVSGLEVLKVVPEANFINIGERTNVAGSKKFARLIREEKFDEALSVARAQVDAGAQVIDVCMDEGMIDGVSAMRNFLNLMASEPEISRVPTMIDSSKWEVIEAGLKVSQGKCIVNSISLKEGEEPFVKRAMDIHHYGAAVVVMLFDQRGQADTFERKIEIAERSYKLLTQAGFPAEDIIFDPNILAVATGIEEHDSYAKAFIDATRWIHEHLPHAKVSGGVSNLSFSFRGNNKVREAMHSVFLYHAIKAGMEMAIVNPQMLQVYSDIEPELLERVEDVVLCRRADATERLLEYAQNIDNTKTDSTHQVEAWRTEPVKDRIVHCMVKGISDYIETDIMEGYNELGSPMEVIDQLLMPAMDHVGTLFGRGEMFLPQVVKTARIMKSAIAVLNPYIDNSTDTTPKDRGRILIATVKGDVHDIGKNIVSVVMSCSGYQINDLGVMVESTHIVDQAVAWGADVVCLSGLITPSLDEMTNVCKELERRGLSIPVVIGGATTSALHTAVKIAPHYSGVVIHSANASTNNTVLSHLLGEDRDLYIDKVGADQLSLRNDYNTSEAERMIAPIVEVRKSVVTKDISKVVKPQHKGRLVFPDFDISDVEKLIDWNFFFNSWGVKGRYPEIFEHPERGEEAKKLYDDAQTLLQRIAKERLLKLEAVVGIFAARSHGDDIIITDKTGKEFSLPMLRNQTRGQENISLADFVAPQDDYIGCFAATAGVGLEKLVEEFKTGGDEYNAIMVKLLADRLTEAFAETLHSFVRRQMWGYETGDELTPKQIIKGDYKGLRMAFGYPASPDHSLKRDIFKILAVDMTTSMSLTENYMITPGESLCGLIFDDAKYFSVGKIDTKQLLDYSKRRKMDIEEVKRLLPNNVN